MKQQTSTTVDSAVTVRKASGVQTENPKSSHQVRPTKDKRVFQARRHNASRISLKGRESSYQQTMEATRKQLPRATRGFSTFIHHSFIERVSDILGNTIARPHAILAGGIVAFVCMLGLQSYARYAGFSLQGSETLVAFGIGWLGGTLYDIFRYLIGRKDS